MRIKWITGLFAVAIVITVAVAGYQEAHPHYSLDELDRWAHGVLTGKQAFDQGLAMTVTPIGDGIGRVDLGEIGPTTCRAVLRDWGDDPTRVFAIQAGSWGRRTPLQGYEDWCGQSPTRVVVFLTSAELVKVREMEIITRETVEASR